jgi:hypothetical protein
MNHVPGLLTRSQQFLQITCSYLRVSYLKTLRSQLLIICLNCMAGSQVIFAQWSSDPGVNTLICTAPDFRYFPQIIRGDEGSSIVVWYDRRNGGSTDIYAQRINAAGVAQWTANGIAVCTAANDQYAHQIISDGAGGAIITWYDYRNGSTADIYAQRITASGVLEWAANGVAVCAAPNNQFAPTIIPDGGGGAIIAWDDYRDGGSSDIYAQYINASGVMKWTANGIAVCTASRAQHFPALVWHETGNAIITWYDNRSGSNDIYAQMINATGTAEWTINGVAVCTAANDQYIPWIVSDGEKGAIITWYDYRNSNISGTDIYAQRINSKGIVVWNAEGVAICNATKNQLSPSIVSDDAGGAIIRWDDNRNGDNAGDIYAQRVNANGVTAWQVNGVAICNAEHKQSNSTFVPDGEGGAIITWMDRRIDGNNDDIYAQRINGAGMAAWVANGIAISTAANDQAVSSIASDGAGGAIITWFDYRKGTSVTSDIYVQNVNSNGTIGCIVPVITDQPLIAQTVFQGTTPGDLLINATGGNLKYQWYSNTVASKTGAINLNPAGTGTVFTPSTATPGTVYYYCTVTGNCDTLYSDFARVTVDVPVSRLEVTVSPNPTESFFNVTVRSPTSETVAISMFDMLGRLVQLQHGAPGQTFRLGNQLAAGMYIIEVRQAEQVVITKAIKQ